MSLPYYTLSSLGISNDPPAQALRNILGASNVHQMLSFGSRHQFKFGHNDKTKEILQQSSYTRLLFYFFPVPADVRWQHSGPFKFFKNVSTTLVLRNSSGSNILWNGNNQHISLKYFGPKEDKTNTSCRLVLGEWTLNIEQTAVIIIINSVAIGCK